MIKINVEGIDNFYRQTLINRREQDSAVYKQD